VGYEELIRHLIRTAETRRDGILARAREEAAKITEDARRTSETVERDGRDGTGREASLARIQRMNRARQEANEMRLRARATVVDAVLARVEERLPLLLGEARYPAVAERLYMEILPELPEGNILVHADGVTRAHPLRAVAGNGDRGCGCGGRRRHVPRPEHAPVPVRESPARVDGRTMEEAPRPR
jgi:vacuolar-type H+-ATPase subunit E/Vma4